MRIVQVLPELNEGGVERGTVELNRELVKRGVDSIVVSAGGQLVDQIEADGGKHIKFDVCSKNPLTAPQRIYQLRKLLKKVAPDILHARSRVPAWLAYLANKNLKIPFVTTVHGFNSVNAYSRVMTYGDRVICVSNVIKEYIQNHYQVPDEKVVVIPRGVDLELFDPENLDQEFILQFKNEYQLNKRFVVTSVGRITQLKDYETFIRGIVTAKKEIPSICGLIVGGVRTDKKAYFEFLQNLVKELHAEDMITFVGSQKRVAEIYSLSNLVVICSKKPESFGRTAAEALAMNVPVVSTAHGGVLDILEDWPELLFQPGDVEGFVRALQVAQERTGENLRSRVVSRFSLAYMVQANFDLYHKMTKLEVAMGKADFGYYRLPAPEESLARLCQAIPFNSWTRMLLFLFRKPVLMRDQSPVDLPVKGAKFRLYPGQNLSDKRLLCTPNQLDGPERRLLAQKMEKGSVLIDLGANIGGYCLLVAAARKDISVVAVEADLELARRLQENVSFSGFESRVKVLNVAVADQIGRLVLQRNAVNRGQNLVVEASEDSAVSEGLEVEALPLLEILDRQSIDRPGAVKLDLEGYEFKVLQGFFASAPKSRWPPFLQLEQYRNQPLCPAYELAEEHGYKLICRTKMNAVFRLSHLGYC